MNSIFLTESTNSLYQQGKNNQAEGKYDLAIIQFNQFLQANPNHPDALAQLAFCLRTNKRPQMALTAYRQALRLVPGHSALLLGIAHCYKDLGNFDKAINYYEKSLKTESGKIESMYNLTLMKDYSLNAPLIKELQKFHEILSETDTSRVLVCFALGKIYESHGQHKNAFQYYEEANRLHFSRLAYSEKDWFNYFDRIESVFNADLFTRLKSVGSPDTTPIFIVGMPRSGSSLIEHILASHSAVYGNGEVDIIPRIAGHIIPQMTGLPDPQGINNLGQEAFTQIIEQVLRELRSYCLKNKPRITDKTLRNYAHIGLIHLLFPRATIIHCVRDPMDTCWSILRQHFGGILPYCYDQIALGRFYCRYQQLMHYWHTVLPNEIFDVQYEQLVKAPEATIRTLLEYCGLPFEENCLAFYQTKRAVVTASARQVRRPIYTASIKSWEPIAEELAPLRAALQV